MSLLINKNSSEKPKSLLLTKADADRDKPTRYFSDKQEKDVAKTFQGKQTANSGATAFIKGDVLLDQFLIECKTKTSHADSMSIKREWLEKNRKEAAFMGKKYSALAFNFGPDEKNYYIIDEILFQELVAHLIDSKNEE